MSMSLHEWINYKNAKQSGMTAIHYAAFNGDMRLMRELLNYGADIKIKNYTGMSALQFAAQGNQAAALTYLLDCQNFDINEVDAKCSTALHWAIFNSNELALSYLLARSPKVDAQDVKGVTPLHLAVISPERPQVLIRMLLMHKANPNITDLKGRTPLQYAKDKIKLEESGRLQVISLLEDAMDVNKGIVSRLKGAFTLDQPIYKIRRSRKTMIGFFATMIICQLLIQSFIFPYLDGYGWLKSTVCSLIGLWAFSAAIVQSLGPGVVERDTSVSLMELLDNFDVREICPTCKVITLPRSRHCIICNTCVDRFDHHCQWLNNCIGRRNHG